MHTQLKFYRFAQQEKWTNSVRNHDKEHAAASVISVRFVWGYFDVSTV